MGASVNDQSYHPLCADCDEDGVITLATQVLDAPWGRVDLCERHYDQAGELGAAKSLTEDVSAGERYQSAHALDRRLR